MRLGDARPTRVADVHVHRAPVLPRWCSAELPPGAHVLIMTHDHAEDFALVRRRAAAAGPRLDRADRLGAKWARFRRRLAEAGHDRRTIGRISTPDRPARASPARSRR